MKTIALVAVSALALLWLMGCSHPAADAGGATATGGTASSGEKLAKLEIKDIKVGNGGEFEYKKPAQKGDSVFMAYTGTLADGTVFDSNKMSDSKQPFSFTLGGNEVIKGWDEGIPGMKIGGERKLSIPASLAYGDKKQATIPPGSDLYFDVTLLDIVPYGTEHDVTYDDVKVGNGPEIKKGSRVTVNYTVSDLKGNILDSRDHFTWTIGNGNTFDQIETGMTGMRQGGVRVLRLAPAVTLPSGGPKMSMMDRQPKIQHVKIELISVL